MMRVERPMKVDPERAREKEDGGRFGGWSGCSQGGTVRMSTWSIASSEPLAVRRRRPGAG